MSRSSLIAVVLLAAVPLAGCASAVTGSAQRGEAAATTSAAETAVTTSSSEPVSQTSEPEDSSSATTQAPIRPSAPETSTIASTTAESGDAEGGYDDVLLREAFVGSRLVDAADFPGLVSDIGFQTPSGNIFCGFYGDGVVCQIGEYDYTPPEFDCGSSGWGFNFGVDATGGGFMFCAGDVEGGGPVLDYGDQIVVGDYHCVSRETGVTCVNAAVGGGFSLARAGYELF